MKKRKPFYRPTGEDMQAAAARAIVRKHPSMTFEAAHKYLEDAYQAEIARLRCQSEAVPSPKPSGRVLAFPARLLKQRESTS